jgi:hypothetical protein
MNSKRAALVQGNEADLHHTESPARKRLNASVEAEAHAVSPLFVMMRMIRADLADEVCQTIGMSMKESDVLVHALFDSIVRALRSGARLNAGIRKLPHTTAPAAYWYKTKFTATCS